MLNHTNSSTHRRTEEKFKSSNVFAIQEDPNEDMEINKKLDLFSSSINSSRRSSRKSSKISSPLSRSLNRMVIDEVEKSTDRSVNSRRREPRDYDIGDVNVRFKPRRASKSSSEAIFWY